MVRAAFSRCSLLVSPRRAKQSRWRAIMVLIGLLGATLLYGDGCITPAISVLSAIEGVKVYAPHLEHAIVPLTVVILAFLFRDTAQWHLLDRQHIRAGHAGLVRRGGRTWNTRNCQIARGACCVESRASRHLSFARWTTGFRHYWWCFPCRNGWRSILCRHGALWPVSNSRCLVRHSTACADAELFWPRWLAACRSECDR